MNDGVWKEGVVFRMRCGTRGLWMCFVVTLGIASLPPMTAAQDRDPIHWSIKTLGTTTIKAGEKFTARVAAAIDPGWHLYSLDQAPGGPLPTRIWLPEDQKFKLAGDIESPVPQVQFDTNFNMDTQFYNLEAVFSLPIVVAADAQSGNSTLSVNAFYQTCNDDTCLPPKTVKISTDISVIGPTSAPSKS